MYKAVKRIISSFIVGCAAFCSTVSALAPEEAIEEEVRSYILARLAGQIYWSETSDLNDKNTRYRLCIYRDRDYFVAIQRYLSNRTVRGKKIQLMFTRDLEGLKGCHISYVGNITEADIAKVMAANLVKDTIFVASSPDSAALGLHIRLYLGTSGTIDIEVNQTAFAAGGNEPSVAFVKLAKKVYGSPDGGVH